MVGRGLHYREWLPVPLNRQRPQLRQTVAAHLAHQNVSAIMRPRVGPDLPIKQKSLRGGTVARLNVDPTAGSGSDVCAEGDLLAIVSRLSWKWRKRSSVKIAERTYE